MNARIFPAILLLATALPSVACTDAARPEAASLLAAIDRFRRAEYPQRPSLLAPLKEVACKDAEVCATKDACLAYANPMVEAIVMKAEVQKAMDDPDAGAMPPETRAALIEKLDLASRKLDVSRAAQTSCDDKTIALKVRYKL